MSHPFENPDSSYLVLVNTDGQYSLWPTFLAVPSGWTTVLVASPRAECLEYVKTNWTDMRPASLKESESVERR